METLKDVLKERGISLRWLVDQLEKRGDDASYSGISRIANGLGNMRSRYRVALIAEILDEDFLYISKVTGHSRYMDRKNSK